MEEENVLCLSHKMWEKSGEEDFGASALLLNRGFTKYLMSSNVRA